MKTESRLFPVALAAALMFLSAIRADAADRIGVFETVHRSSLAFAETAEAVEAGLRQSSLELHAVHDVRVPDDAQQARVYILTSPDYLAAAAAESPRTVSAQILRVAVFTRGEAQQTFVNMANPRAHAMVYYSESDNYDTLLSMSTQVAQTIRDSVAAVPGEPVSIQRKPLRTEKQYRKYNGDGPARMMAKFRNYRKSQLPIQTRTASEFDDTVADIVSTLAAQAVGDASDESGWQLVTQIPIGADAVYLGLTNPYMEHKMIRINSKFRNDDKSASAPYPGVDHVTALPTDVLVIREDDQTHVLHYGQMWRMQLYFWDSGYRAFTANMGVPTRIVRSIDNALKD